jgi:hypothetical protein
VSGAADKEVESEAFLAKKEPSLFDSFQYKGVWWFPNRPDTRLPGVLVRDEESFTLELFDAGGRISSTLDGAGYVFSYQAALVLGQLEDGKPCTLHQTYETNRPRNSEGFEKSVAEPSCAFIGVHFPSPDAIRFRSVTVEFTDLAAWMFDSSPFVREDIEEGGRFQGWRVSQRVPEATFANVPAIDATVGFGYSASTSGSLTTHELSVTAGVTISPKAAQGFEWYLGVIRDIQNWLTLLIGRPVQPARLRVVRGEVPATVRGRGEGRRAAAAHPSGGGCILRQLEAREENTMRNPIRSCRGPVEIRSQR